MTLIYINKKFPRTKQEYKSASDDNTDKLKEVMSKLTIASKEPEVADTKPRARGGFVQTSPNSWSYTDRQKKKVKTFKL